MQNGLEACQDKLGCSKIVKCCEIAARNGFMYVWVDTCCIDKTSSSELSEAINSMYRWYEDAAVCYVSFSDVPSNEDPYSENSSFRNSRYFTRGWTLQELIAPVDVIFFSNDWKEIGTKLSLQVLVSQITRIPRQLLSGVLGLDAFSIAQRMSRASNRRTTRLEDTAYSLMGLFGVNMPMIYGEGPRAFERLQREIINVSDDQSIFAWRHGQRESGGYTGLLALSPESFAMSQDVIQRPAQHLSPFSWSNGCIQLRVPLQKLTDHLFLAILNCERILAKDKPLAITLIRVSRRRSCFKRAFIHIREVDLQQSNPLREEDIFIKQAGLMKESYDTLTRVKYCHSFSIKGSSLLQHGITVVGTYPPINFELRNHNGTDLLSELEKSALFTIRFRDSKGAYFDITVKWDGPRASIFVDEPQDETIENMHWSLRNELLYQEVRRTLCRRDEVGVTIRIEFAGRICLLW